MSYSENNTFEKIMERMLGRDILIDVDKRVGSIIYDALAPCAMELAEAYAKMDILQEQTYLMTATGTNLEKRVYDYGIVRKQATQAQRIAEFKKYQTDNEGNYVYSYNYVGENQGDYSYDSETQTYNYVGENQGDYVKGDKILIDMDIPVGSRFVVPENQNIIFEYIGLIDGYKIVQCESAGIGGNEHLGTMLPIVPISGLIQAKIISTYKYGENEETDSELRARAIENLNYVSFGGNIADYIEKVNAIDGVGNTKVFPAWQYNGSVLLSVVDPQFNPITQEFIQNLKQQIDPNENTGEGVGIAPIGHYVTVTTPIPANVEVALTVELRNTQTIQTIQESIENKIEEYFDTVRKSYGQNVNLTIYRSDIIVYVKQLEDVLNVTDVKLNGEMQDLVFIDEGLLNKQYLPYVGGVIIE